MARKPIVDNEKRAKLLRRTATEIKMYSVHKKVCIAAICMLLTIVVIFYIFAVLYQQTGSFTVSVDKFDMTRYGLTLSEYSDMAYQSSNLNAEIHEQITNISGDAIPVDVDMIDGEHNGENYIAYTLYLQNAGEVAVSYEYALKMSNVTNGIDSALRIRLYVDGTPTTSAKTKTDGTGPELGTTEFYAENIAAAGRKDDFAPGEITKFTVVIWIEGTDLDCQDWLIGGKVKVDMNISIVH
ncbi:MAG: hypothetical protein IJW22_03480 [Clostridia bacterium]|nr:hypothetical protein [Clostridia bacterium]